jgi:hypothetical protein
MQLLGLTDEHLRDAMAEIARHLLGLGARLAYGGDLRAYGFTELLFELVARHGRDADSGDERTSVVNYLAWPVHIREKAADLEKYVSELAGSAELIFLSLDGDRWTAAERFEAPQALPTEGEWTRGLTAMRKRMGSETHARIILGGRVEGYEGTVPGIAEEALLSLHSGQPLFIMGGFGGCARDLAETLGLLSRWVASRPMWNGREAFLPFKGTDLRNGLTPEENAILARTPHVDQAVALILRGLLNLRLQQS